MQNQNRVPHKFHRQPTPKPDREFLVEEPTPLLEFLLKNLSGWPRNKVKSLLARQEVFVGGKAVTQFDHALKVGQRVRINGEDRGERVPRELLHILYEDDEIIVINKPSGLLSIATDKEEQLTAYHLLADHVRRKDPDSRVYIVHRLDRDTSGVFLIAKTELMKHALQDNWEELVTERGYVAVVEGKLAEQSGFVKSWLKETKTHIMYSSDTPGEGRESVTRYRVMKENERYSMVDIALETGRKNQIRVHMKDLGHPVAGDKKYGAETDPLRRLCLHAHKLAFVHPFTQKEMRFETPPPKGFTSLVSAKTIVR